MGIAEESLDAEGFVKPVMLGELISVIEADGFAYRLWKFTELTSDGPGGEDSFSIDRVPNHAEAGLSFVENQQPLATSGEQLEAAIPPAPALGQLLGPDRLVAPHPDLGRPGVAPQFPTDRRRRPLKRRSNFVLRSTACVQAVDLHLCLEPKPPVFLHAGPLLRA